MNLKRLRWHIGPDASLDRSSEGHSLVRVDKLVQFGVVEEVPQELLDLGDPGGAFAQHDVVDRALAQFGVSRGLQGALEEVRAELFEFGSGDGGLEVFEEQINLDVSQS